MEVVVAPDRAITPYGYILHCTPIVGVFLGEVVSGSVSLRGG